MPAVPGTLRQPPSANIIFLTFTTNHPDPDYDLVKNMNALVGKRGICVISAVFLGMALALPVCSAQQGAGTAEPLVVRTVSLPKAYLKRQYETRLEAQGGVTPLKWEVTDGALPSGITLLREGTLSGVPREAGEFHFTVTVTDSNRPAYQRTQGLTLLVVAPLLVQWNRTPKVTGQRVEGSVDVSNQTEWEFDLTFVVLAVNEDGRATAIGYQRFPLKKGTVGMEIPFGENLPQGTYQINVDVVAEVALTNSIYRARLVQDKLLVQQGP
jgi:hypothetical protein